MDQTPQFFEATDDHASFVFLAAWARNLLRGVKDGACIPDELGHLSLLCEACNRIHHERK